jgi:hypothetical protein
MHAQTSTVAREIIKPVYQTNSLANSDSLGKSKAPAIRSYTPIAMESYEDFRGQQ